MNAREKLMVSRLTTRIVEMPDAPRDPEAELELAALLKVRPDAPYLLLQRVLLLEAALEQAQAQLAQQASSAPNPAQPAPRPSLMPQSEPAPAAWPASPATAAPAAPGFLRQAATIGAGVLGGSLLFQGIESLLHSGGGHGLLGGGASPVTVYETNNFIEPGLDRGGERSTSFDALDDGFLADGVGFGDDSDLV